jgi:ABC-type phosphate transport system substrate-binding protein
MISLKKRVAIIGMAVASSLVATSAVQAETVAGGGASFPEIFIKAAMAEFNKQFNHSFSYDSKGSGTGQSSFKSGTYDFGGSDSAVTSANTPSFGWTYVPYVAGAIAITYRLDELKGAQLSLSQQTAEKIFNGSITKWNDPAIAKDMKENPTWSNSKKRSDYKGVSSLWQNERRANSAVVTVAINPSVVKKLRGKKVEVIDTTTKKAIVTSTVAKKTEIKLSVKINQKNTYQVKADGKTVAEYKQVATPKLPDKDIIVVYRADGSGTSANFGIFMKSVNPAWGTGNNHNTNVPGGVAQFGSRFQGQQQSSNQSNYVADTNGSIGYSETSFAYDPSRQQKGLRVVALKNNFGQYIQPSSSSYNAFLAGATVADNGFVTFNYARKTRGAYPIGAVTYILARTAKSAKGDVIRQFIEFMINDYAPQFGEGLGFVPLSGAMKAKGLEMAKKVSAS